MANSVPRMSEPASLTAWTLRPLPRVTEPAVSRERFGRGIVIRGSAGRFVTQNDRDRPGVLLGTRRI